MPNVLYLGTTSDGIPLLTRLASEGCKVDVIHSDNKVKELLKGLRNIVVVTHPQERYSLTISDGIEASKLYDLKGNVVLGGGPFKDKLDSDGNYSEKIALTVLKELKLLGSFTATNTDQLKERTNSSLPLVLKSLKGNGFITSKEEKNRELISKINTHGDQLVPCLIKDRVEGIEVTTEGWFNGVSFLKPFNHSMKQRRLMDGERSLNIGCSGIILWFTRGDRLTKITVEPLTGLLKKVGYIGPIRVTVIISGKEVYFINIKAGVAYDNIYALHELLKMSLFNYLFRVVDRQNDLKERDEYLDDTAIGIRLTAPYAMQGEGWHLVDIEEGARKHVWLNNFIIKDNKELFAGINNVIGCVTARGMTIKECQRRVYRTIRNVVVSDDVQYRSDIGRKAFEDKFEFERFLTDGQGNKEESSKESIPPKDEGIMDTPTQSS